MLLDTNALLLPFRTGLDLLSEVERWAPGADLVVPSSVLDELDRLVERGVVHAIPARVQARRFRTRETTQRGDAAVLSTALAEGAWVVTADRALARRLTEHGIGVLVPRDRTRLELRPGRRIPSDAATVMKRARLGIGRTTDARRRSPARPAGTRVRQRDRRRL
ncbi:MAG: PIN domain-containing protein [Thermoplasmata archaeon]